MPNTSNVKLLRYWKQGVYLGVVLAVAAVYWSYKNAGPGFTTEDIEFLQSDEDMIMNWKVVEDLQTILKVEKDLQ
ncbi:MAG: hypothetical protein KDD25_01460 [Bdellovibrionales bacterium]|nr:hypothetical protein [Bdellovibrionales bacterium]